MSVLVSGRGPTDADGVIVRQLLPDEWEALRDIRLRALADAPDAFGSTLSEEVARGDDAWRDWASRLDRVIVVAERGGRLVGLASGGPAPGGDRAAGLYAMWVDPQARGTGAAPRIVALVEDWARAAGYGQISLGVTMTNGRAIAFYERLGYVDTGGRHPLRQGAALEIQVMVKSLGDDSG
jgi:ribosomal protein S18 acetylase RimI-like enzyme